MMYPRIRKMTFQYDQPQLPLCTQSGPGGIADVQIDVTDCSIDIAIATAKF